MTRGKKILTAAITLAALLAVAVAVVGLRVWARGDRTTSAQLRSQLATLEEERDRLRARREALVVSDQRLEGMPDTPIRVGVPTSLARQLIEKVVAGFADRVTVELRDLKVAKTGTIKRVVTLGSYDLHVTINQVAGRLKAGKPAVGFGDNRVSLALPVTVASGSGRATVHFTWKSRNVGRVVCGDMDITQEVRGNLRPDTYKVSGSFSLVATDTLVRLTPHIPGITVRLMVDPSDASWAAAQKVIDDKRGVCGFVLDRVDVLGPVRAIIDRGFNVRLPTEKIRAMALPVGVEPQIEVRGRRLGLRIRLGGLAITKHAIWVGAHVSVAPSAGRIGR